MNFDEILTQITELLQRQGRVSYGALKRRYSLDDDYLQDLKDELIDAQHLAADEDGKILVWIGQRRNGETGREETGKRGRKFNAEYPESTDLRAPNFGHQTPDSGRWTRLGRTSPTNCDVLRSGWINRFVVAA